MYVDFYFVVLFLVSVAGLLSMECHENLFGRNMEVLTRFSRNTSLNV